MSVVEDVKRKKEFSGLPDSVVKRALEKNDGDIKNTRKLLRKYFGVFLTNRVLRFGGRESEVGSRDILNLHLSSKKRDYEEFYGEIFKGISPTKTKFSIIDLGCGVNGFSYEFLPDGVEYVGVEAAGQLVGLMNDYFGEKGFDARAVCLDLFDIEKVLEILKKAKSPRVVFMFQVVDALENLERDFSKKFILAISKECEKMVISLPLVSLGGRKRFAVRRKWLVDFLESEFVVEKDFEMNGERVICFRKHDH